MEMETRAHTQCKFWLLAINREGTEGQLKLSCPLRLSLWAEDTSGQVQPQEELLPKTIWIQKP